MERLSIKELLAAERATRGELSREEAEELRVRLAAEELGEEVAAAEGSRAEAEEARPERIEPRERRVDGARERGKEGALSQIEQIESILFERYEFRRNVVCQELEFRRRGGGDDEWREVQEEDENDLVYELKRRGFRKPQDDMNTLLRGSLVARRNPVTEYYEGLRVRRPGAVRRLTDCVVLDEELEMEIDGRGYRELFEEYMRKWLTACYLCNMGVQRNDVMLILIGAQGRFKTSFLNHLCPESMQQYLHCGNINPSISDYNTATYLMERMLINVDDQMENIFGKDYNTMKSVITADIVSRRTLYKRSARNRRRIANFCGSVNESHFLRDSNNRRYLCFKIADIRPEYREVDMDDVWAEVKLEADARRLGYVWGKEDFAVIDQMNEFFMSPTEEDEALKSVFAPAKEGDERVYLMQFSEVMRVLKAVTGNGQLKAYSLQTAMRKYGYVSRMMRARGRGYPCNLYAVRIVATDMQLTLVTNMVDQWRSYGEG